MRFLERNPLVFLAGGYKSGWQVLGAKWGRELGVGVVPPYLLCKPSFDPPILKAILMSSVVLVPFISDFLLVCFHCLEEHFLHFTLFSHSNFVFNDGSFLFYTKFIFLNSLKANTSSFVALQLFLLLFSYSIKNTVFL